MTTDISGSDMLTTQLAERALDAFWQVVGRHFPTTKTGDLSIDRSVALQAAAESAIAEWVANNVNARTVTN